MWKLLRNLMLVAILIAGILKLLAWYEVGQDAQRLTAAFAPYAQVHYDGIAAGLDGSVSLSGVSVAIKRDKVVDIYAADSVVLESPSVFWLLKHALFDDDSLPPHFGFSVHGLKMPATPWFDPQTLNPATLVPFETVGCDVSSFAPADYRQMGVSTGEAREYGDYRYDADARTLDLSLTLIAPGLASVTLEGELRQFDPQMLKSPEALRKLHIEQLSADYMDSGYLQRRNQYCGKRANIGPAQFAEQHVAAVQALLQQHNIEAGTELVKLYRHLVENGGQASILSLPSSNFVAGTLLTGTPEDLLRQLNVTARYGDTPPVMFRMSFPPPPEAESALATAETPPGPAGAVVVPATVAAATPASSTAPAPVAATTPPPAPTKPTAGISSAPSDKPNAVTNVPKPAPPATPPPAAAPVADNRTPSATLGMSAIDQAEAKLAPLPKSATSATSRSAPDFLPSGPPPPPGSTLALVWKPTIERLPAAAPEHHDYDLIDFASLKSELGRRVRLITDGGKKVEGYVITVDDAEVEVRISGVSGDVHFTVPKGRIREIQLVRHSSPPA